MRRKEETRHVLSQVSSIPRRTQRRQGRDSEQQPLEVRQLEHAFLVLLAVVGTTAFRSWPGGAGMRARHAILPSEKCRQDRGEASVVVPICHKTETHKGTKRDGDVACENETKK